MDWQGIEKQNANQSKREDIQKHEDMDTWAVSQVSPKHETTCSFAHMLFLATIT